MKPKMNCFICETERTCKLCLDTVCQKKTYSTDINKSKRQPPNEKHQMLPTYVGEYEPRQNIIDFESAREILVKKIIKWLWKTFIEDI